MSAKESAFQGRLIKELQERFPGCVVMKNDSGYRQGIPDLTVLHGKRWAALECKRGQNESHQPNQDYYVDKLDGMGFARFIFPENREKVLGELDEWFK